MHNTITHTNSAGGLCLVTNGEHCDQYSHNPLHSQGECGDHEEPHNKERSSTIILRQTGSLSSGVVPGPTHKDAEYCTVNLVIVPGALNSNSARGTEHCKCQGHLTLIVQGALNICGATGTCDNCGISEQCLDWYRSGQSFHFSAMVPLQIRAGACLSNLTLIIESYLIIFYYYL